MLYEVITVNTLFGFEDIAQGCITIDLEDKFIAIDANYEDGKLITDLTLFTKETELYSKEQDSITQYYHDKQRVKKLLTKIGFKIESINDFYLVITSYSIHYTKLYEIIRTGAANAPRPCFSCVSA